MSPLAEARAIGLHPAANRCGSGGRPLGISPNDTQTARPLEQAVAIKMEALLTRHRVLMKCVAASFLAHVLFLSAFNVAEVRQKPLPSYLQFSLLPVPSLWERASPLAQPTSNPDEVDTSLLVLTEIRGGGSGPKLELFHKQLLWEEEPEKMGLFPSQPGPADRTFRKEEPDYSLLLNSLGDTPSFLASGTAEDIASSAPASSRVVLSDSLQRRRVVHRELPSVIPSGTVSYIHRCTRLSVGVDQEGAVRHILIEHSSGDADADAAALRAVSKWRFSPEAEGDDGSPLWGWIEVPASRSGPDGSASSAMGSSAEKKKGD